MKSMVVTDSEGRLLFCSPFVPTQAEPMHCEHAQAEQVFTDLWTATAQLLVT